MAAKDADLARDFSSDFVFISNDDFAKFEVEILSTPQQSAGDRSRSLFLSDASKISAFEIELTATPHAVEQPPIIPDTTPPTITNLSPGAGTGIESTQVISFDITDETGLAAVVVIASFSDGTVEVVHDNDGFRGNYVGGGANTRSAIAGGWHYTVRRIGGWHLSPTFEWLPVDTSGNIGVLP